MPAKHLLRTAKNGSYNHIYNQGIEGRVIFTESEDYEVFLTYLAEYLSPPANRSDIKRSFTINGKVYQGTPHLPKNYYGKLELVAYGLMPNHFHLVLHQKADRAIEGFVRSLGTRYSMYYNKKYNRSGSLFQGPYKSSHIKDDNQLYLLTRFIHREQGSQSSYPDYLGQSDNSWVNPKIVLSGMKDGNYKKFVEDYEPTKEDNGLIADILLEKSTPQLVRIDPPEELVRTLPEPQVKTALPIHSRIPEIVAAFAVFTLLIGLGIRNIQASAHGSPQVLSFSTTLKSQESNPSPTPIETPQPTAEPVRTVTVVITDGSDHVNIRSGPATSFEKIDQAQEGQTFELVNLDTSWYQVKLSDGTGYIYSKYIQEGQQ